MYGANKFIGQKAIASAQGPVGMMVVNYSVSKKVVATL